MKRDLQDYEAKEERVDMEVKCEINRFSLTTYKL